MSDEPAAEEGESYLEIQMDRSTIVLAAVALVALLAGAFLLGSWFGSRGSRDGSADETAQQAAAAPEDATAAGHDGEDVSAEEGFGGKPVSARGAPPVGAVPPPSAATVAPPRIDEIAAATAATARASAPSRREAAPAKTSAPAPVKTSAPARVKTSAPTGATAAAARASAPAAATTVSAPTPSGSWIVQVAAVKERREADQLADRLRKKGYAVRVIEDAGYLKVQVGPFSSKTDALASERRLKSQERLGTWLKPA